MSKKSRIIEQLKLRLKTLPLKQKPKLGYPGVTIDTFPSAWIIEGVEELENIKPGIYSRDLPVAIEYYIKGVRQDDAHDKAKEMEEDLLGVIELDERFADSEGDIAISYGAIRIEHVYYPSPQEVICVSIGYKFKYVDKVKGYQFRGTKL